MAKVSKRGRRKSAGSMRATLRQHLEAQWMRGQGSPSERAAPRRVKGPKGPRSFSDPTPPATLGDVAAATSSSEQR